MPRQACLLLCLCCASAVAQLPVDSSSRRGFSALEGTFRDSLGHPISFGVIRVAGTERLARANDSGFFHLDSVTPGRVQFTAMRTGYSAAGFVIDMPAAHTVHADVRLHSNALTFASGMDASARPSDAVATPSGGTASDREACQRLAPQHGAVVGIVRDETGTPVPYANISFEARSDSPAIAERNGCFVMHAPANTPLTLVVRRIGYREHREVVQTQGDSSAFVDVRLLRIAVAVDGVTVTAQRDRALEQTGFYDRLIERKKGIGDGWFITPEEIEKRNYTKITSFIGALPTITLRQSGFNTMIPMGNSGHCIMAVYVDGTRIYYPGEAMLGTMTDLSIDPGARAKLDRVISASAGKGIDEMFSSTELAAIEVYPRAAQAPPQYQMLNGACGMILIWTKR